MKVRFHSPITFEGTGLKSKITEVREGYRDAKAVDQIEDDLLNRYQAASTLVNANRTESTVAVLTEVVAEVGAYIQGGTASKSFTKKLNKLAEVNAEQAIQMLQDAFPGSTVVSA